MFSMMGLEISTVTVYPVTNKTTGELTYCNQKAAQNLHDAGTHTASQTGKIVYGHLTYLKNDIDWWVPLANAPTIE